MRKLIVDTEENAPAKNIAAILATWGALAELVDQKAKLPEGCWLVWQLTLQHVGFRGHVLKAVALKPEERVDCWEAYGEVKMVFNATVAGGTPVNQRRGEVVLTDVSEIMINDDGTFFWHSEMKRPEDSPETIAKIATAVCTGRLPGNYNYRCSWIPDFKTNK